MEQEKKPALWPGWETVRVLGQGSYGAVYEIRRDVLGREEKAALKCIRIPKADDEIEDLYGSGFTVEGARTHYDGLLGDIVKEYQLMAELRGHANIVSCEDISYERLPGGVGWDVRIKMELLTPLLRAPGVQQPEALALALGRDLCKALIECRNRSIVHRDIKPQNIFISEFGDYKLGDFGIARTMERTTGATKTGTYNYMAPEVYHEQPYGHQADVYSLGLVLYWLLNQRRLPFLPLPPQTPTAAQMEEARIRRFRGDALPPPADGSEELKRIVLRACAFEAKERYAHAGELYNDLEALRTAQIGRKNAPVGADALGGAQTTNTTGDRSGGKDPLTPAAPSLRMTKTAQPAKKRNKGGLLVGAAAVLVLALAAIFLLRPGRAQNVPTETEAAAAETAEQPAAPEAEPEEEPAAPETAEQRAYAEAEALLAEGKRYEAAVAFYALGDYSDARARCFALWDEIAQRDTIAASEHHTFGLKADGTVVAVGLDTAGLRNVGDWTEIAAIAAGGEHTVGLKADGTVVAVGDNDDGQCEVGGWTDIVAVAAGIYHTVGLRADGTVVAVGRNDDGQCEVGGWTDIVAVAAGGWHTVGLRADGTVVAVGANQYGRCEVGDWTDIVAVAAGGSHTVGLKADGTVVAVGVNGSGRCEVGGWTEIVAVAAGSWHTVGLRADGTVVAVGENYYGQCEVGDWTDIMAIAAGSYHTVGLKADGTVITKGRNANGQRNTGGWTDIRLPN